MWTDADLNGSDLLRSRCNHFLRSVDVGSFGNIGNLPGSECVSGIFLSVFFKLFGGEQILSLKPLLYIK